MTKDFVNSILINGTETQIQDYGRGQPNGVPVLDPQGKLPTKYIPDNIGGVNVPVGTLISQYKKVPMSGYLYCDGSTFDENAYPALYMYLGTNVLPDYRECVMVGAEQNTTDTIATHDVYGEGEFKDDQLQMHKHSVPNSNPNGDNNRSLQYSDKGFYGNIYTDINTGRTGDTDTTHGKQKAVYVYIKATSGLAENQQENVLNDVKGYVADLGGREQSVTFPFTPTANGTLVLTIAQKSADPIARDVNVIENGEKFYYINNYFGGTWGAFSASIPLVKGKTYTVEDSDDVIMYEKAKFIY